MDTAMSPGLGPLTVTNALYESGLSPQWQSSNPMWDALDSPSTGRLRSQAPQGLLAVAATPPTVSHPEEVEFAANLASMVGSQVAPEDVVLRFAATAFKRAQQLREEAAGQLHSSARYARLEEMAEELELEAASWQLLRCVHGIEERSYPGGLGGPASPASGFVRTYAQQIADVLYHDDVLNRVARVVAWLELLAAQRMDVAEQGASGNRFGPNDGLWNETRNQVAIQANAGLTGAGTLVSELDPDAPTRQHKALGKENAREEERLMAYLWQLVRAGRLEAARQLCFDCGQPWRAASLGGGGAVGPVPVGAAADRADEADNVSAVEMELADEVSRGSGTARTLWLWSTSQLAEQASWTQQETGGGSGGGVYEAALYAALCGHLKLMLPACTGWEDVVWAYFRAWLDLSIPLYLPVDTDRDQVDSTIVVAAVALDAAGEGPIVQEGTSCLLSSSNWPLNRNVAGAVFTCRLTAEIPPNMEELLARATAEVGSAGGVSMAQMQHRQIQCDLILCQEHLEQLLHERLLLWVTRPHGTQDGSSRCLLQRQSATCSVALLRFAAHLGIMLQVMKVIPGADGAEESLQYDNTHDAINKLIQAYVGHLMDHKQYTHIAMYCCFMRKLLRKLTCTMLLEQLALSGDVEQCRQVYTLFDATFRGWDRQQELLEIFINVADEALQSCQGGPRARAQATMWLLFEDNLHEGAGRHMVCLCRDFALAGLPGVMAAWELLNVTAAEAVKGADVVSMLQLTEQHEQLKQELRFWMTYFQLQRQVVEWQTYMAATLAERDGDAAPAITPEEVEQVMESSSPLLDALIQLVQEGALDTVCAEMDAMADAETADDGAAELRLWVVPMPAADEEAYMTPTQYKVLEEAAATELAGLLQSELRSSMDKRSGLTAEVKQSITLKVEPGVEGLQGSLHILAQCPSHEATEAVLKLLSEALKGLLGFPESARMPLQVINCHMPASAQGMLLRLMQYPALILGAAEMRETLLSLGGPAELGAQLVPLAADAVEGGPAVYDCMHPAELQELVELERLSQLHLLAPRAREPAPPQ